MFAMQTPIQSNNLDDNHFHILVVDDEAFNRTLLVRIFSQYARVSEAQNGHEALDLIQSQDFDIVLLDIMMPDMSGLDVLAKLRDDTQTDDLPVILISALDQNDDIVRGLQIGANDYVSKPFDIDVMNARVKTQLKLKHMLDVHKQSIARLQEAQAMKDRLFSIATHDIKSPLHNIGFAEDLLRQIIGTDDATIAQVLDTLKATVATMNQVVEEFLEASVVQTGHFTVNMVEIDLQSLLVELIAQHRPSAQAKQIEIFLKPTDKQVYADYDRLKQAVSNFVSNAIKYSPLNTTVTIYAQAMHGSVRICVADQGPGIPVDERDKLFKEFSKLSTRPTAGEHSSGLGLWIVKQMIELQGGRVGVDCPPEGGSIFWAELPSKE